MSLLSARLLLRQESCFVSFPCKNIPILLEKTRKIHSPDNEFPAASDDETDSGKMASLSRSYIHSPRRACQFLGRSMGQHLYHIAELHPEKEMYVFYEDKERKTFKEMKEESQNLAASFVSLGLKTGDRIGIWGGNHFEWLVTYCACMQLGIILVHIRMDFPQTTQKDLLAKIGCKALVLTRSPENVYDRVCEIIPELRSCEPDKLSCEGLPDMKFVVIGGQQHKKKSGTFHLDDLIFQGSTSSNRSKVADVCLQISFDAPQIIIFTSGSTGFPKAVTHSSHSLLNFIYEDSHYLGNVPDYKPSWETKFALIMNLSGVGAQMGAILPLARGCTTVVVSPAYDKDVLAKALSDEKCTECFMLIHHINDLLELPYLDTLDFSSMEIIITGGSMIASTLREKAKRIAKMSLLAYGSTEALAPFLQHPTDPPQKIESGSYRIIGGCEMKIVDGDGQIVPVNTTGEIHYRGFTMFLYYWGDEEKTKAAKDSAGWWHSSDMGVIDEDGYIRIVGRKSDFLIIEGINVSPYNLEKVLDQHPSIANVMVVGVPDKRTNEAVCVCVRLKPGMQLSEEEVKKFSEKKVSQHLTPRYVVFMDEFPATPTGKFHRIKIAQMAAEKLNLISSQ